MTEEVQTIVSSDGPEKARYLARMDVKFKNGLRNIHHTFNFEGLAKEFGGKALYTPIYGIPPIMANGVRFPDQETHDRAWESVYAGLNRIEDEMEAGNCVLMEFGDHPDPDYDYVTEQAKIEHALQHRKGGGRLSKHDAGLVEKGILGVFTPPVQIFDIDNYRRV